RPGIAEPGKVAHVHQYACAAATRVAADRLQNLFAKNVFVADVGRHSLSGDVHWSLADFSTVKVPQGDAHGIDEPAKARGHEFAKGHEVCLVVALRRLRLHQGFDGGVFIESDDAVRVAVSAVLAVVQRDTHQQGCAALAGDVYPIGPDLRVDAVL